MFSWLINKLKTIRVGYLLWLSVIFSEILTAIIVSLMSIFLHGKISNDHLIIGAVTSFIVSFIVVWIIINILRQLAQTEESLKKQVAEHKQTSETLYSFQKASETMQLGVTITDMERKIIYTNLAEAEMHGYTIEELIGRDAWILAPPHLWKSLTHGEIQQMKRFRRERINVRKDGSTFPVQLLSDVVKDTEGNPIGIVTTCEDITDRKQAEEKLQKAYEDMENRVRERTAELTETVSFLQEEIVERNKLEAQLRHVQKMEAIGQLAGGIAHDFNNILTAIIGYASFLQMKMKENDPLRHNADQILASAERAANLTYQLLTFSRKQIIHKRPINLNEVINNIKGLLSRLLGEHIELNIVLPDENMAIMADPGQIEQVLINLSTNARDAMPNGGILSIETKLTAIDTTFIKTHGYGEPGIYALISVTDTGAGIAENLKDRIFEPFFTTKELGRGTGLGLSIIYGIIKQHGGYVSVNSEPGKGTTFNTYIPVTTSKVEEPAPKDFIAPMGGLETILLAEDDDDVRNFTNMILEEFGYTVIKAVDGEEAVKKFIKNKDNIDLLLFDLVMPKKNGKDAYEEIKKLKPDIKALFASGYASDFIHKKEIIEQGLNFISKPVPPREMLKKVREVLDKKS